MLQYTVFKTLFSALGHRDSKLGLLAGQGVPLELGASVSRCTAFAIFQEPRRDRIQQTDRYLDSGQRTGHRIAGTAKENAARKVFRWLETRN
jgi:hypothetical protein